MSRFALRAWHRALAAALALALGAGAAPLRAQAAAPIALPSLGDPVSEDFGVGTESKLGDQIMREIRPDPAYLDDPWLLEYVNRIWQPLVTQARAAGHIDLELAQRFAWEAFLVRDRAVNAFALPGGYVGVHLGLIAMTTTRDELASVLAHELTHVSQRHIARGLVNSRRQSMLSTVAMLLGMIAATRANSGDAAQAVIAGSQAAAVQGQLNFSRDMEREADRIGFLVYTAAGFAPAGMAAMFERLEQSSRLIDNNAYPYLRSHPLTGERIGEARSRLGAEASAPPRPTLEHAAAQARARVLADTRVDALRRWQAGDADRSGSSRHEQLTAALASALASTLLREHARADAALARARTLLQGGGEPRAERAWLLQQVEALTERGAGDAALRLLEPLAAEASRPVLIATAQAALVAGRGNPALKRSADDLQTWLALHPADALAWQVASQTWARLEQPLRALRADAESRLALADFGGAIERLRAAQRLARGTSAVDHIDASVIDARLRELEAQRRREIEEQRAAGGRQSPP